MIRKIYSAFTGISRFVQVLVGLALLAVFASFLSILFTSRSSRPASQSPRPDSQALTLTSTPTPSPLPATTVSQTDPSAGWQVYTNKEFEFSVKYPEEWFVKDITSGLVENDPTLLALRFFPEIAQDTFDSNLSSGKPIVMAILVSELSVQHMFENVAYPINEAQKIELNGVQGYKFATQSTVRHPLTGRATSQPSEIYLFNDGRYSYMLVKSPQPLMYNESAQRMALDYTDILERVVNSFKLH